MGDKENGFAERDDQHSESSIDKVIYVNMIKVQHKIFLFYLKKSVTKHILYVFRRLL